MLSEWHPLFFSLLASRIVRRSTFHNTPYDILGHNFHLLTLLGLMGE